MMKLIILNVMFIFCLWTSCYSQVHTKKIFIDNKDFTNSKVEFGNVILKADTTVVEKFDYDVHDYYIVKNQEIKNDNKWLVFYHVNNLYWHNVFVITITKGKHTMKLLFAFKQYDENNPQTIFLENISFSKGTYFFDFVDNKIIESSFGQIDDRFGDFHLTLKKSKKFRLSRKILTEDELKRHLDNPNLKRSKIITKILSVFKQK